MLSDNAQIIIGTCLLFGIIASFIPQYITFAKTKSSEGFSSYFLFIVTTSTFTSLINGMIFYKNEFADCYNLSVSSKECYLSILGFIQILALWLCLILQYSMFIYYLHKPKLNPLAQAQIPTNYANNKKRDTIIFIIHLVLSFTFVLIGGSLLLSDNDKKKNGSDYNSNDKTNNIKGYTENYARFMGLISLIGGTIQFLPQIYKTYKYKMIGSISLLTLAIQVPGSYIWVGFFIMQDAAHYSTWIPYLAGGILQTVLFLLCLWIKYFHKKSEPLLIINDNDDDYENNFNTMYQRV